MALWENGEAHSTTPNTHTLLLTEKYTLTKHGNIGMSDIEIISGYLSGTKWTINAAEAGLFNRAKKARVLPFAEMESVTQNESTKLNVFVEIKFASGLTIETKMNHKTYDSLYTFFKKLGKQPQGIDVPLEKEAESNTGYLAIIGVILFIFFIARESSKEEEVSYPKSTSSHAIWKNCVNHKQWALQMETDPVDEVTDRIWRICGTDPNATTTKTRAENKAILKKDLPIIRKDKIIAKEQTYSKNNNLYIIGYKNRSGYYDHKKYDAKHFSTQDNIIDRNNFILLSNLQDVDIVTDHKYFQTDLSRVKLKNGFYFWITSKNLSGYSSLKINQDVDKITGKLY